MDVLPALMATLALSLLLAACSLAACGLGGLLLTTGRGAEARRTLAASVLVGFFLYAATFGLAAQLAIGFSQAAVLFASLGLLGLLAAGRLLARQPCLRLPSLALVATVVVATIVTSFVPVNPGAADPHAYAFGASAVFRTEWIAGHVRPELSHARVDGLLRELSIARAPSFAILWLPAAFGWPVVADEVAGLAIAYLAVAAGLLADVLDGPLLVRLAIAAGAFGLFNLEAALVGGQLGQTFALLVSISATWLCRRLATPRARSATLFGAGYLLAGGYPEFLPAVPLYLGCILLLCRSSWRQAAAYTAALGGGYAAVQLTTQLTSAQYLLRQSGTETAWWPLAAAPANLLDVWFAILSTGRFVPLALPPALVFGWYVWRVVPGRFWPLPGTLPLLRPILIGLAILAAVWGAVALRASNPNYATFKLGGWLGPGLFLLAWLPLGCVKPPIQRVLATCFAVLAVNRALLGAGDARGLVVLYHGRSPGATDAVGRAGQGACVVHAPSQEVVDLARGIAASAAAARGCDMVADDAPAPATQ